MTARTTLWRRVGERTRPEASDRDAGVWTAGQRGWDPCSRGRSDVRKVWARFVWFWNTERSLLDSLTLVSSFIHTHRHPHHTGARSRQSPCTPASLPPSPPSSIHQSTSAWTSFPSTPWLSNTSREHTGKSLNNDVRSHSNLQSTPSVPQPPSFPLHFLSTSCSSSFSSLPRPTPSRSFVGCFFIIISG